MLLITSCLWRVAVPTHPAICSGRQPQTQRLRIGSSVAAAVICAIGDAPSSARLPLYTRRRAGHLAHRLPFVDRDRSTNSFGHRAGRNASEHAPPRPALASERTNVCHPGCSTQCLCQRFHGAGFSCRWILTLLARWRHLFGNGSGRMTRIVKECNPRRTRRIDAETQPNLTRPIAQT